MSINGLARLSLSSTGVSFPDSNPDAVPQVPGTPGPLVLTVKARTTLNATVRLSVLASDDLRSGVRTLPGVDDHVDGNRCRFRSRNAEPNNAANGGHLDRVGRAHGESKPALRQRLDVFDGHIHADDDLHAELAVTTTSSSTRAVVVLIVGLGAVCGAATPAAAQVLQVQPATITFPSSDPDTVPVIAAAPIRVSYVAQGAPNPWTITVRAGGDLISGASTIPISNVSWTATPSPPFRNGTLSTVAQTLATGTGLINIDRGDVTFRFVNSWNYTVGNYTQTVTFTLSSP